jgi:hypothetical protein
MVKYKSKVNDDKKKNRGVHGWMEAGDGGLTKVLLGDLLDVFSVVVLA